MVGAQKQHRVIEILESSHIFMLPSVTAANGDQEGLPVALMEAMAMGLPVLSTLHSGIPELVEDGLSGLLVPEKDVKRTF
jgi:colanic acid/amylovoran biosynthesis glycosyltransferase